jgi:hypothetical protein
MIAGVDPTTIMTGVKRDQLGHQRGVAVGRTLGEPVLDPDVATLAVAEIAQAAAQRRQIPRRGGDR